MIKALSIRQPWAYAIVHEGKIIENRSRRFKYRGPLAIHAAARPPYKEIFAGLRAISTITGKCNIYLPQPRSDKLQYGGIIGLCDVVDCVTDHASPWFTGPYGLVLANIRPVPFLKCSGQLGLFNVDVTLEQLAAPENELARPDTARTIGDLRATKRRLIMKCQYCRHTRPIDLATRPIPPGTQIKSAQSYLTCPNCGSRNIATWAEPETRGKTA